MATLECLFISEEKVTEPKTKYVISFLKLVGFASDKSSIKVFNRMTRQNSLRIALTWLLKFINDLHSTSIEVKYMALNNWSALLEEWWVSLEPWNNPFLCPSLRHSNLRYVINYCILEYFLHCIEEPWCLTTSSEISKTNYHFTLL